MVKITIYSEFSHENGGSFHSYVTHYQRLNFMKPSHSFSARPALPPRSGGPPNQDLRWNFFVVLVGRCWKFLKLVKISKI
jgi:hypothetical protein